MSNQIENHPMNLFHTLYEPSNQAIKGTVLVLHGKQENSGRYVDFANFLSDHGFVVLTYDHPAHGKRAKKAEDFGYLRKNPVEHMTAAAREMVSILEAKYSDKKHFIIGHSMSSFITRVLMQTDGHRFDEVILLETGGKHPGTTIGKGFLRLLDMGFSSQKKRIFECQFC